ncbi:UNVERIFIED_CONTAM: hypothetical protein GTU68_021201 [Idotea baltica]|nr:hypothetical protein [Idotea baltica]
METTVNTKPTTTSENIPSDKFKIVCYYSSWAQYRVGDGELAAHEIDPYVCTHLIYCFIGLDSTNYDSIEVLDEWGDLPSEDGGNNDGIGKFITLRDSNPDLKLLVAIGGSSQNSSMYSIMAANASLRSSFIDSAVEFIDKYGFDGMDFVWEYPANNGGSPSDKENFVLLIQEMKEEFNKYGWILSAAVGMRKEIVESAYDIPALSESLDFLNLLTFDFHDYRENETGHHSQFYAMPDDEDMFLNVNASVGLWLEGGADPEKLILGIPSYSKTFEVEEDGGEIGEPSLGPGINGSITQEMVKIKEVF